MFPTKRHAGSTGQNDFSIRYPDESFVGVAITNLVASGSRNRGHRWKYVPVKNNMKVSKTKNAPTLPQEVKEIIFSANRVTSKAETTTKKPTTPRMKVMTSPILVIGDRNWETIHVSMVKSELDLEQKSSGMGAYITALKTCSDIGNYRITSKNKIFPTIRLYLKIRPEGYCPRTTNIDRTGRY